MPLNSPILDWHGKRVWVIGASSGIGRAVAALLHARGALVYVSARNRQLLETFVQEHPGSQALTLDVTGAQEVACAAQQILQDGPLDLVCYCAGHYRPMQADMLDLPELLQHQRVNVVGALHVLAAVLPALLQAAQAGRTPHLSLVASVAGWRGLPQSLAYGPTKAALINLAENLFLDLRPKGVGVSLINPGFVDTPLTAQNTFSMPALMAPEEAAVAMVRGWERGSFEVQFPKRFTAVLKVARCLPYRWYFPLVHRFTGL
ncbi:MAG TPA: SDR family NAD(P)-dependent oxidoreductase [Pusillimonas sp.]|uniref:SDR family NAD(P)-dependent oxidoreductase n=1 Tax=Pusillimonas sp. TaxID=3040095 RepID=UPI002CC3B11C|nr:SDR family NAD(P)-dependent oxidoreductase [Pusillimonas sp.]HUH87811.1 SDR family NAD(P)-dependent oxidoreductase [Pusillimonas sp.]